MDFSKLSDDQLELMMMSHDPEVRTRAGLAYFQKKDKPLRHGLLKNRVQEDLIEDFVHEGMHRLVKALRKRMLRSDGSVFSYIFTICLNLARSDHNNAKRETTIPDHKLEPRRGTKVNNIPHYGGHIRGIERDQILKEEAQTTKRLLFHIPDENSRMIALLLNIGQLKPGEIALLTGWDKNKIYRINFQTRKWLKNKFPLARDYLSVSSDWEAMMARPTNDDSPINFAVHGIGVDEESYHPDYRKVFLEFFDCRSFSEFNSRFHVMFRFEDNDLTPQIVTITITPVKDFSEVTFHEGERIRYYDFLSFVVRDGRDYLRLEYVPNGTYSGVITRPTIRDENENWIGIEYQIYLPGGVSLTAKKGVSKGLFYLHDPDNPPRSMQITHVYKMYPN